MRRSDSGRDVRTDRRVVRFCTERSCETVMAIVSPETFLTKICIVSTLSGSSGDTDRDMDGEERILEGFDGVVGRVGMC